MLLDSNIFIYAIQPDYAELRQWCLKQPLHASDLTRLEVLGYHKLNKLDKRERRWNITKRWQPAMWMILTGWNSCKWSILWIDTLALTIMRDSLMPPNTLRYSELRMLRSASLPQKVKV